MNEVVPKTIEGSLGYTHSFSRYFELDGQRYDRRALVQEHGILAPAEARRRNVPLKVSMRIIFEGVPDYDDYIFLFPISERGPAIPFGSGIVLSPDLPVLTPQDMHQKYGNGWAVMSMIYGGEFYAHRRIDPRYFRGVI